MVSEVLDSVATFEIGSHDPGSAAAISDDSYRNVQCLPTKSATNCANRWIGGSRSRNSRYNQSSVSMPFPPLVSDPRERKLQLRSAMAKRLEREICGIGVFICCGYFAATSADNCAAEDAA